MSKVYAVEMNKSNNTVKPILKREQTAELSFPFFFFLKNKEKIYYF